MNLLVVAIVAWICLGLEVGFRAALQLGDQAIAPSFVLVLIVFLGLWARPVQLLGVSMVLGALLDLLNLVPAGTESIVVLGPWALGCTAAAYTVLNFRAMVFRRNPLAVAFLSTAGAMVANIVALSLLAFRAVYDDLALAGAGTELWLRLASSLYTGVLSLLLSPVLGALSGLMGLKRPVVGLGRRG